MINIKRRGYKLLNADSFAYVKELISAGRTNREIRNITNRSVGTIGYINLARSFDEYKEIIKINYQKYKAPKAQIINQEFDNTGDFDQLLKSLEDQLVQVIKMGVELKTKDLVEAKTLEINELKAENASLRAVTEAAKKSNLVDTIKKSLLMQTN